MPTNLLLSGGARRGVDVRQPLALLVVLLDHFVPEQALCGEAVGVPEVFVPLQVQVHTHVHVYVHCPSRHLGLTLKEKRDG